MSDDAALHEQHVQQIAQLWAKYRKEVQALTDERDALKLSLETLLTGLPMMPAPTWSATKHLARIIGRQRSANRKLQQAYDGLSAGNSKLWIEVGNLKHRLSMAESNNPDSVLSKHNAMLMAKEQGDDWHRVADARSAELVRLQAQVAELEAEVKKWEWRYDKVDKSMSWHAAQHEQIADQRDDLRGKLDQALRILKNPDPIRTDEQIASAILALEHDTPEPPALTQARDLLYAWRAGKPYPGEAEAWLCDHPEPGAKT